MSSCCCWGYRRGPRRPTWGRAPHLPGTLRSAPLLTQVLAVNTLIVTATVFAASVAAPAQQRHPGRAAAAARARRRDPRDGPRQRLGPAPPLRPAGVADRRDGARRPRRAPRPRDAPAGGESSDVARLQRGLQPHARPPRGRARPHRQRGPAGPGGRARAPRPRPARRGQPGADRRAAAPGRDRRGRAAESCAPSCARRRRVATQAMDELLRLARELRPAALDDHGLGAALRTQVERLRPSAGVVTRLRCPTARPR